MAPLIVLILVFMALHFWGPSGWSPRKKGRCALAALLAFTACSHFWMTDSLAAMIPAFVPDATTWVYVTGILEGVFAVWLVRSNENPALGWVLAMFFLLLLPANIHAAFAEVGVGGHGPGYLWFRIPLQLLFIAWALASTGVSKKMR